MRGRGRKSAAMRLKRDHVMRWRWLRRRSAQPEPLHMMEKRTQTGEVGGHCMVSEIAANHLLCSAIIP
jgi:hypothetical protein